MKLERRKQRLRDALLRWLVASVAAGSLTPALARAWEPFRSENAQVLEGNAHLEKGQVQEAITAYDAAAQRLPNEPGVHLDRGLALLKAAKLPQAREALRLATQASAENPELRGKAHYNLGLAFLREADEAGKQENTADAQKALREAADAFKSSLRASPKNRDAAWNLELTRRRLLELEKKEQEKKDQEEKDREKKDQEQADQQKQDDQDGEQKQQDGSEQTQPDAGDSQPEQPDAGAGEQHGPTADAGSPPQPEPNQAEEQRGEQPEPEPSEGQKALPEHMRQALDALADSEENLQKHRAALRARQKPRRIEKDW